MDSAFKKLIGRLIRGPVSNHHVAISLASLLLSAVAVATIATQWNINSNLKAMLPADSDAARAMRHVNERVGSSRALFVVIDSPDTEANIAFAEEYAERLREMDAVSLAHFHNDKAFFEKHQLLYLQREDLEKLRERIAEKIREAKKEANPLFVSLGDEESDKESSESEKLDAESLQEKYDYVHDEHKEYLLSEDKYALTMVVRFSETAGDMAATERLLERIERAGMNLDPTSYHADMTIDFGGGLVSRQQEYRSIVQDIQWSALLTVLALFLVIALYFRRLRAVFLVLSPLIMGVIWTLALAFTVFGELTTVSVFIFAILLGLGIDFSIHLLSSYDHHRLDGLDPVEALVRCYQGTGKATLLGAFTTLTTFIVIGFANFRGLSQFGKVASIGIVLTLVAMTVVLPSLILTFQKLTAHEPKPPPLLGNLSVSDGLSSESLGRAVPILITIVAVCTGLSILQFGNLEFQDNFGKIGEISWPWQDESRKLTKAQKQRRRVRKTAKGLARHARRRAVRVRKESAPKSFKPTRKQTSTKEKYSSALQGQRSSIPTILLFDDKRNARRVSDHMLDKKERGELDTLASISSIYAFLPGSPPVQELRLEEIRKIKELLASEDLSVLEDKDRRRAKKLRKHTDIGPVDIYDLPDWAKRLFREAGEHAKPPHESESFAFEYMIYLVIRINQNKGDQARRVISQLEQVRQETSVDFEIASQSKVLVALIDEIQGEGVVLIGVALALVFIILMFAFGHPIRGLVAISPLLFGSVSMLGIMGWLGIRFDFFNVIIIPVVIGIGVDDGVHFYRHYLEEPSDSIGRTLRRVGSAIFMTSVTSSIGFGGLAITTQAGLQSIGHVAITGIATTFLATVAFLPALLWLAERFEWSVITAE